MKGASSLILEQIYQRKEAKKCFSAYDEEDDSEDDIYRYSLVESKQEDVGLPKHLKKWISLSQETISFPDFHEMKYRFELRDPSEWEHFEQLRSIYEAKPIRKNPFLEKEKLIPKNQFKFSIDTIQYRLLSNMVPISIQKIECLIPNPKYIAEYGKKLLDMAEKNQQTFLRYGWRRDVKNHFYSEAEYLKEFSLLESRFVKIDVTDQKDRMLQRANYGICCQGDFIFVFGGQDLQTKEVYNDLMCIDMHKGICKIYKDLHLISSFASTMVHATPVAPLPFILNAKLIPYKTGICIIGGNIQVQSKSVTAEQKPIIEEAMGIYFISNPYMDSEIALGMKQILKLQAPMRQMIHYIQPAYDTKESFPIPVLQDYSVCRDSWGRIYISGGRKECQGLNSYLYRIHLHAGKVQVFRYYCEHTARCNHASFILESTLFLHGGTKDGVTVSDEMIQVSLNDLWRSTCFPKVMINPLAKVSAPKLMNHAMFYCENSNCLQLIGGQSDMQQETLKSNGTIFSYDPFNVEWTIVKWVQCATPLQGKVDCSINFENYSSSVISCSSHLAKLYRCHIVQGDTPSKGFGLHGYMKQIRQSNRYSDVVFEFSYSKQRYSAVVCEAHKVIVSSRCEFLHSLIASQEKQDRHTKLRLLLPKSCVAHLFSHYLDYLYFGEIDLTGKEVFEFLNMVQQISPHQHYPILLKMASNGGTDVNYLSLVSDDFHQQFSRALDNPSLYSDIQLQLSNGQIFFAHKVFLARSPVFKAMFETNHWLESNHHLIRVDQFDMYQCMELILLYCYGDVLLIHENCILPLLFTSFLLGLDAVGCVCQQMIANYFMDEKNVMQLYDCASRFEMRELKEACFRFCANRNVELMLRNGQWECNNTEIVQEFMKSIRLYRFKKQSYK